MPTECNLLEVFSEKYNLHKQASIAVKLEQTRFEIAEQKSKTIQAKREEVAARLEKKEESELCEAQIQRYLRHVGFINETETPKITCNLLREFLRSQLPNHKKEMRTYGVHVSGNKDKLLESVRKLSEFILSDAFDWNDLNVEDFLVE